MVVCAPTDRIESAVAGAPMVTSLSKWVEKMASGKVGERFEYDQKWTCPGLDTATGFTRTRHPPDLGRGAPERSDTSMYTLTSPLLVEAMLFSMYTCPSVLVTPLRSAPLATGPNIKPVGEVSVTV